jgi:hypothetical protein
LKYRGFDSVRPGPNGRAASRSHRQQFLPCVCSTELIFSEPRCRDTGFSEPNARPDHHRAMRKEARCSLPVATVPNRSRKSCAFLRCTMSRKVHPMPQARPAPARDPRLPGKLLPSLPRSASVRATPTRPRHPGAYEIPCTPPRGEHRKAPAEAAARAPPEPLRHPRLTAGSYPPSPLPPLALSIRGFLLSSRVPNFTISVVLPVAIPRGEPLQFEWERVKLAPITARTSHHSSGA